MRKNFKKLLILGVIETIILQNCITVGAAEKDCLLPTSENIYSEHLNNTPNVQSGTLPSSVDLSTSQYFPNIDSQGGQGSCAAFSTVYYQYTYEVNRLNKINSKSKENCYSPKWTYNALNQGKDNGISIDRSYDFLKLHGALKWNEFVYNDKDYTSLPTDVTSMRNALNTRLKNWETFKISGSGTVIISNTDDDLDDVKRILNSGHVLQVSTHNNWKVKKNNTGEVVAYRCAQKNGGHSMIIVGYDDNIWIDVNGNNKKDAGEYGAFKLANSWGTNGSNTKNGFMWVLYDALNKNSVISGNWEKSFSDTRVPAFAYYVEDNYFNEIEVENKQVEYVAEINYNIAKRNQLSITIGKSKSSESTMKTSYSATELSPLAGTNSYTGTTVLDMGNVMTSLAMEFSNYKWYVKLKDNSKDGNYIRNANYKITDNLGNVINKGGTFGNLDGTEKTLFSNISLTIGDVDYSGKIDNTDANIVLRASLRIQQLSNAQQFLADYNRDGVVNNLDAKAVLNASLGIK